MKLSTAFIIFAALFTASPAHGNLRGADLDELSDSTRALKGTPDEETPATEEVCDDFFISNLGAYGLCVSYCEARDCDEVYRPGCDVVKEKFEDLTNESLPCEATTTTTTTTTPCTDKDPCVEDSDCCGSKFSMLCNPNPNSCHRHS